jgi:hypothetical protein
MNVIVVYDSIFGNTSTIAHAIAEALGGEPAVRLLTVGEAIGLDLAGADLLIVGSPTRGFQPTPEVKEYLAGLQSLPGSMAAAVFDTRLDLECVDPAPLRWVIDVGGYASSRMAAALHSQGIQLRGEPGAFLVTGNEGPLKAGEIDRARKWARGLVQ